MKSILESVIEDIIEEESKQAFIDKVAKKSGRSKDVLSKVYARGIAAAKSSGHRPGANPVSWAKARVYSFLQNDPKHDQDLQRGGKKKKDTKESVIHERYNPETDDNPTDSWNYDYAVDTGWDAQCPNCGSSEDVMLDSPPGKYRLDAYRFDCQNCDTKGPWMGDHSVTADRLDKEGKF